MLNRNFFKNYEFTVKEPDLEVVKLIRLGSTDLWGHDTDTESYLVGDGLIQLVRKMLK